MMNGSWQIGDRVNFVDAEGTRFGIVEELVPAETLPRSLSVNLKQTRNYLSFVIKDLETGKRWWLGASEVISTR